MDSVLKKVVKHPEKIVYGLERKGLLDWLSEKEYIKITYRLAFGRKLNLDDPKALTEKINWYKLYYRDPLMRKCVDKYEVRQYVRESIGDAYLNECFGVWNSIEEIDYNALPNQFVLKPTNGSGDVVICKNKSHFNWEEAIAFNIIQKRINISLGCDENNKRGGCIMRETRKPGGGRKKSKPEYDAGKNLKEQLDAAVALYEEDCSLQSIADALALNPIKVRKLLITAGIYESDVAETVQHTFYKHRETQSYKDAILSTASALKLSKASVTSYLPYERGVYFPNEAPAEKISAGAERQRRYRAMKKLRAAPTEEHLWEVVLMYQKVRFKTYSGLPFSYEIRKGRSGKYTKELWIDRRENSKSLAWSSVLLALGNVKEIGAVIDRPKALGDIRGVTCIYGMFYRFGLIDVPDDAKCKMNKRRYASKG